MSITKDQIIEAISAMSVMDVTELIVAMEKKFGISANTPSTIIPDTISGSGMGDSVEEKTEFNLVLKSIGSSKIAVIKAVRSMTNLGLKEAKDLVESAPVTLKEGISKNDAELLTKSLEEAGAKVEIE